MTSRVCFASIGYSPQTHVVDCRLRSRQIIDSLGRMSFTKSPDSAPGPQWDQVTRLEMLILGKDLFGTVTPEVVEES